MRNPLLKIWQWCLHEDVCLDDCRSCDAKHDGPNPNKQSGIIPTNKESNTMAKKTKKAKKPLLRSVSPLSFFVPLTDKTSNQMVDLYNIFYRIKAAIAL